MDSEPKLHPHLSLLPSQNTYSSFRIQLRCRFLQEVFFACPSDVSQVVLLSTPRTRFLTVIITLRTMHFYCPLTYLSPPGIRGYATVVHICQMSWATQLPVHRRKPRLEATTGWLQGLCSVYYATQILEAAQKSMWTSRQTSPEKPGPSVQGPEMPPLSPPISMADITNGSQFSSLMPGLAQGPHQSLPLIQIIIWHAHVIPHHHLAGKKKWGWERELAFPLSYTSSCESRDRLSHLPVQCCFPIPPGLWRWAPHAVWPTDPQDIRERSFLWN